MGDKRDLIDALIARGDSIVCPTSVDRVTKQWSADNTTANPDVTNIDGLLTTLGVASSSPLFLIGHSDGGGFTSRFALRSQRVTAIRAIQISNAAGITQALQLDAYRFPTLFNYADCDPIVDASQVRANIALLASKALPVPVGDNDLDAAYAAGTYASCHELVSTPDVTSAFFADHAN